MHRIGQGYDLHRLASGLPLFLGGIPLDSPVGCVAHSDGDVLLHALIDALLGACALGDIGDHFPPSDPQYRGVSSLVLLVQVLKLLKNCSVTLINLDATVFLESPKLYPYKRQIREKLADVLGLPLDRVSLKAKTMEGLGSIGHQEAIAAMVTVLLQVDEAQNPS